MCAQRAPQLGRTAGFAHLHALGERDEVVVVQPSAREIEDFIHLAFASEVSEKNFCIEQASEQGVRVRFFSRPGQLRPGGTVSGPAQMSAADLVAWALVLRDRGLSAAGSVTSNLNINFLARPSPGDLIAEGELLKIGKRQAVCSVRITSDERLVAHATVTYAVMQTDPATDALPK